VAISLEDLLNKIIFLYDENINISDLTFRRKVGLLKDILNDIDPNSSSIRKDFTKDLDEIVDKRNIFAHCSQDFTKMELNLYNNKNNQYILPRGEYTKKTISLFNTIKQDLEALYPFISKELLKRKFKNNPQKP